MFNPGRNSNQVSVLRLVNPGASTVNVSIAGIDDAGHAAPEGTVSLQLAPHAAVEVTSQELEAGNAGRGLVGRLGAGEGKWLLNIEADQPMQVMSLLRDPQGYLTNLSNETRGGSASLDP
ncbi:MAG TPA: hypothetical protein VFY12_03365, partial [Arenimonas sp.]|nr:hypothetical protein [Arenimonas sp.]